MAEFTKSHIGERRGKEKYHVFEKETGAIPKGKGGAMKQRPSAILEHL